MTRDDFDAWRASFNSFLDCSAGAAEPGQCASAWADGVDRFIGTDEGARRTARAYAEYYVGLLRDNGGKSADCRSQ